MSPDSPNCPPEMPDDLREAIAAGTVITDRAPPIVEDWLGPVAPVTPRPRPVDRLEEVARAHRVSMHARHLAMGQAMSDLGMAYRRFGDIDRCAGAYAASASHLQAAIEIAYEEGL